MIENNSTTALDDGDGKSETKNQCWGWWMVLPVVAGFIACQIADAAMTS